MKNLKELEGVKLLSKNEQKSILGGLGCDTIEQCPSDTFCCWGSYANGNGGLCRPIGYPCF